MDHPAVKHLITHCINGDKGSFRKIVEIHQTFVFAVAFRMMCSNYEAEEVVQETFIRVWNHLGTYNPERQFRTWLYKIAVNICYDRMRSKRNKTRNVTTDSACILNLSNAENLEGQIINSDLAAVITTLTGKLTPKQKMVFTLSELEGLSFDEISEITGLSHEKIRSNLYCARQAIKEKLEFLDLKANSYVR